MLKTNGFTTLQNNFIMAYTSFGMDTYANGLLSIIVAGSKAKTENALMSSASEILSYPNVKAKIEAIEAARMAQVAEKTGWDIEKAQKMLLETRERSIKLNQPAVEVSSVVAINRMFGMDKDAGTKDTVTVINVINYAGVKVVESEVINE